MDLTLLQGIAALATALGLGTAIPALFKGVAGHVSGRAERERTATQEAIKDRDNAWRREDAIRTQLHTMQSYAARLRRFIIEHCTFDEERYSIPEWPAKKEESDESRPR